MLSGHASRGRKLAICSGTAPLTPAERIELLAVLSADADEQIAERASSALLSQPLAGYLEALARADAARELFRFCARHMGEKPGIADAMAHNPACPPDVLATVAAHLSTSAAQDLIADLDRLSSVPALAAALATSTSLTAEQRALLQELQMDAAGEDIYDEILAEIEPDRAKRQTLLQKLAKMRVVERVQLALKGGREERLALIRDPCKVVQRAVLQSPRLTEREVEGYSAMSNLSDEVLRLIAHSRHYVKNYTILRNLVNNPKTTLDVSLHLLPQLNVQDLKMLATNRNVADTLRKSAMRLNRQRQEGRG